MAKNAKRSKSAPAAGACSKGQPATPGCCQHSNAVAPQAAATPVQTAPAVRPTENAGEKK